MPRILDSPDAPRIPLAAWATILTCGLIAMAPWLARPFDGLDVNAGSYFGVFCRNWDHLGWLATRGLPLLEVRVDVAIEGTPYVNHPPLTSWTLWLGGSAEWQMRLTSMLATLVGALALRTLLRPRCGHAVANLAACVHLALPLTAIMSQTSYECFVTTLGLTLLAALQHLCDAEHPRRRAAQSVVALSAFLGVGFDWSFGVFCIATIPLTFFSRGGLSTSVRRLLPAGIAAIAAVAAVMLWKSWVAAGAPTLPTLPKSDFVAVARQSILDNRPSIADHLAAGGRLLVDGLTWPIAALGAIGVLRFAARTPRLAFALLVAGLIWPMLYGNHILLRHRLFFAYLTPLIAASTAFAINMIPAVRRRRGLQLALGAIVVLLPLIETYRLRISSGTDYYAKLGATMSAAAEVGDTLGVHGERVGRYVVAQSFVPAFGYYLDTRSAVPTSIRDLGLLLAGAANLAPSVGLRYLWIEAEQDPPNPIMDTPPGMLEHLEPFPRERCPKLEGSFVLDGPSGETVTVHEAWLYTIKEPAAEPK